MTAVLDYGEIMSKKRLTEKKEQNARLVYSDLSLKQGFKKFLLNPMYIFPVLISTILCYAYYLTHETVTIDSLSSDRYYHGLLVAQGRLTATIIENYLGFEHKIFIHQRESYVKAGEKCIRQNIALRLCFVKYYAKYSCSQNKANKTYYIFNCNRQMFKA